MVAQAEANCPHCHPHFAARLNYVGNTPQPVQRWEMNAHPQPGGEARFLAEEILRTLYGDDYTGCAVNPERIAELIQAGLQRHNARATELIELYEKVVEAVHLLSTPPEHGQVTEPEQLRALLSERLDGIRAVTAKTMETTALVRAEEKPDQ